MNVLDVVDLSKRFGRTNVVSSVALRVEAGQILGLLGPNGAGKTTTIAMISGLLQPTTGTVSIAGFDVQKNAMQARMAVGLVPQELALYDDLSATQNLAFFASLYKLSGALKAKRIDWALEVAGLRDRADDPVGQFSGGMKRRLNLSAGILHKPRLLLLDEPTVGVDPQSRNHMFESIRALRSEMSMGVLYCSHHMEEVQSLCDSVAIMDHGQIIASDRVRALLDENGTGFVDLEVDGDVDEACRLVADYTETALVGTTIRIARTDGFGTILNRLESAGVIVRGFRTGSDSLESLFLAMTGRSLRDA